MATSMSAAGLANLRVIDATNYAAITIENEIVWVTAHTGGATTATIVRGQEGTVAAAHSSAVAWQHGPTAFDLGTDWTTYTPTLTQSATVTKTVTYARYTKMGRTVTAQALLSVTGAGTASNGVLIGLPTTAATGGTVVLGSGYIYDASANLLYGGIAEYASTTTVQLLPAAVGIAPGALGVVQFTAALASGDSVSMSVTYESLA